MKKLITIIAAILISIQLFAQAPQKMSYQAVIRNASNTLVTNAPVKMKISILQGSATGTAVYSELHSATTNANGLVTVEIGGGTSPTGTFSAINWGNGTYYLKTETDPTGGDDYTITGTTQLLSVPYALESKNSERAIASDTAKYAKNALSAETAKKADSSNFSSNTDTAKFADNAEKAIWADTATLGGFHVVKLHTQDELNLVLGPSIGPNVPGSSWDIGDISQLKGLILEWRMNDRNEVFHQFIYLSDYDKKVILGNIETPTNYPRMYTTILSDNFGQIMWLGVSIENTQLYLSTNSEPNPSPRLQRIFGIL